MKRVLPGHQFGKKGKALLKHALDVEENVMITIIHPGIECFVQELLEQVVTDHLEREHSDRRRPEQEHRGYRNGCERGLIRTAEGEVVVQVSQVRDSAEPYRSRLVPCLPGHSDLLEQLVVEMYARDFSTRDIEDAQVETSGGRSLSVLPQTAAEATLVTESPALPETVTVTWQL